MTDTLELSPIHKIPRENPQRSGVSPDNLTKLKEDIGFDQEVDNFNQMISGKRDVDELLGILANHFFSGKYSIPMDNNIVELNQVINFFKTRGYRINGSIDRTKTPLFLIKQFEIPEQITDDTIRKMNDFIRNSPFAQEKLPLEYSYYMFGMLPHEVYAKLKKAGYIMDIQYPHTFEGGVFAIKIEKIVYTKGNDNFDGVFGEGHQKKYPFFHIQGRYSKESGVNGAYAVAQTQGYGDHQLSHVTIGGEFLSKIKNDYNATRKYSGFTDETLDDMIQGKYSNELVHMLLVDRGFLMQINMVDPIFSGKSGVPDFEIQNNSQVHEMLSDVGSLLVSRTDVYRILRAMYFYQYVSYEGAGGTGAHYYYTTAFLKKTLEDRGIQIPNTQSKIVSKDSMTHSQFAELETPNAEKFAHAILSKLSPADVRYIQLSYAKKGKELINLIKSIDPERLPIKN